MEERDALGERVDRVDDVVELPDQRVDVLAVERRDERAVEAVEGLVGEAVGGVFFLADLLQRRADVRELLRQLPQVLG